MKYNIPTALRPYQCQGLIRLGKNYDGGYIVNKEDILNADGLISFGVSYDWTFERDFAAFRDVPIVAYDGSVNLKKIWKHNLKNIFRIDRFEIMMEAYYGIFNLYSFFDGKKHKFESLYVGSDSNCNSEFICLEKVVERAEFKPFFIKMDIEGSEYSLLNDLLILAPLTSGLCLEFHKVQENLIQIIEFIENYPLTLVHTHINNCAPASKNGLPQLIELSFSQSQMKCEFVRDLPTKLDMSNSPKLDLPEIEFI